MRKAGRAGWVMVAVLLSPFAAFAQDTGAGIKAVEYRKWDLDGSVGLLTTSNRDFAGHAYFENETRTAWRVDAGRYLTKHVKAGIGITKSGARTLYSSEAAPDLPRGSYTHIERVIRPTVLSAGATYQFLENVFAHPYVTAGADWIWQAEQRTESLYTSNQRTPTYTTIREDRRTSVLARPIVAAGFKSYFNEQVFMRSEVHTAFGLPGVSSVNLRIGAGVDF